MADRYEEPTGAPGQEVTPEKNQPAYAGIQNNAYRNQESLRYRGQQAGLEGPATSTIYAIRQRGA